MGTTFSIYFSLSPSALNSIVVFPRKWKFKWLATFAQSLQELLDLISSDFCTQNSINLVELVQALSPFSAVKVANCFGTIKEIIELFALPTCTVILDEAEATQPA